MTTVGRVLLTAIAVLALGLAACDDSPTRTEGRPCGGFEGLPCGVGQFCDLPAGDCQTADLFGVCEVVPEGCTEEYVPVCGCDGVTYGNDCARRRAQVQKSHDGECS